MTYATVFNVVWKFLEIKSKIWISNFKCFSVYTLMKILIVESFISIVHLVAKLKFFKVLRTDSASTKWPFLGSFWALTPPKYGSNITEILTRGTIMDIIFWYFTKFSKFYEIIVIISNKHGIYKLPQELPNDLRLSILGN